MTDPLVIGIGNPDRGDDAAGVLVSRSLTTVRTKELSDCTALLDVWENEQHVIVVDAMRSGQPAGTVVRFDAHKSSLPVHAFASTHSFGLAETIELGRALNRLPRCLVVFGIEVGAMSHGRRPTASVKDGVESVIAVIEAGEV